MMESYEVTIGVNTGASWPELNKAITDFLTELSDLSMNGVNPVFRVTRVKMDHYTEFPVAPTRGAPSSDRSL